MIIYIDSDYKCHLSNDNTLRAIENEFFDGKCNTFIEGYRFVPSGETWTREDGTVFTGEMISPWKSHSELDQAQREYEKELYEQQKLLINELEQQAQAARILLGVE